jgi:hypothetical protein
VTVYSGSEDSTQTWPFARLEDAEQAYQAAVARGQFVRTLATSKGGLALTLVSLWRRQQGQTITGDPAFWYEEITPAGC